AAARRGAEQRAPAVLRRRAATLVALLAAQGTVGYVQYFTQLPVVLVGLHVTGATLAVVVVARLLLTAHQPPPA
ncbi:MAG TPA: hypothetical protein DEP66_07285, partial [Acidimicrobiaceae bacterium]|nr:hypothetical protein [Acidimicrobiaceae bacterium]